MQLLLLPLSAAAQPQLRWQAHAERPQQNSAKLQIARALGRPWSSIESKLALRATIRGVDGAYEFGTSHPSRLL
ncbi:MAG TPA: hypothetical protein VJR89_02205 [Polyangiales bacterium]|nr:hypothetical protein [Polyangiales bacterium]